jgi:hypothetical protein
MGFMDKAKKLAEQAQQKLDEAQKEFTKGASPESQPGSGGVRYDEHGRPVERAQPGARAPESDPGPDTPTPDPADPTGSTPAEPGAPTPDPSDPTVDTAPTEPASPAPPAADQPPAEGPPASAPGGANPTPDPFKPLQQ